MSDAPPPLPVAQDLFKALADSTRLRLLVLLAAEGELCVCEIAGALELAQPKISRHLAMLRRLGLVTDRRNGVWNFYALHPGLPAWAGEVLRTTAAGLAGQEPCLGDRRRLVRTASRDAHTVCPSRLPAE